MLDESVIETEVDEAKLVERAINLDGNAFGRLYDMHVDKVYRHIYYRVGNEGDAEHITQQVFLKAWEAIRRYKKTETRFIAWLMTISHTVVIDFCRTRYKRDKAYLEADIMGNESVPGPEQATMACFDQQQLRRAILQLPKDQQHVILLRFVEGFRDPEIASIMGKSEGAIRVILHRGLVALRLIVEKENENVEEV